MTNLDTLLKDIEKEIDNKFKNLSIWECSFESIYRYLLNNINKTSFCHDAQRLKGLMLNTSHLYNDIKKLANGTDELDCIKYKDDLKFIIAYSYFCTIMPQYHKGIFKIKTISNNIIELEFKDDTTIKADIIDIIYSTLSTDLRLHYPKETELIDNIIICIVSMSLQPLEFDFNYFHTLFEPLFNFNKQVQEKYLIQVLNDNILNDNLEFNYLDYIYFTSAILTIADSVLIIDKAFLKIININNIPKDKIDYLYKNKFNLNYSLEANPNFLIYLLKIISKLSSDKINAILKYFIDIHSTTTNTEFRNSKSWKDGGVPSFTLVGSNFLFSPHIIKNLTTFNNILFLLNEEQRDLYNSRISGTLEPTLIGQLEYLFSKFSDLKVSKNVNIPSSEIDLLIISEREKICMNIQVKTTIAPTFARSTSNVQNRVIEAEKQIKVFEKLSEEKKQNIIKLTFGTDIIINKYINIIIVRSAAGSSKSWAINDKYKILNYVTLANILADKLEDNHLDFKDIELEIEKYQQNLITKSNYNITYKDIPLDKYTIKTPILFQENISHRKIINKILKYFPEFTSSHNS